MTNLPMGATTAGKTSLIGGLAAHLAAGRARTYIAERYRAARHGHDGHWSNGDVLEAFLRTVNAIEIVVDDPRTVRAVAPATHNGRIWAYVGGDALNGSAHFGKSKGTVTRLDEHTFILRLDY